MAAADKSIAKTTTKTRAKPKTKLKTVKRKEPRGRPSDYKVEYNLQVYKFALLGLTEKRMAELLDITEATFNSWKKKKPGFLKSLRDGQEPADARVADALIERAAGYKFMKAVPIKVKEVIYENGKRVREYERVEVTMVEEVIPPDSQAIKYFMNNRRRRKNVDDNPDDAAVWAERQEIDHTTKGDKLPAAQVYLPADISDEDLGIMPNIDPSSTDPQNP